MIYNVKHPCALRLNFGDNFCSQVFEAKANICSSTNENVLLYCCKFSVLAIGVII